MEFVDHHGHLPDAPCREFILCAQFYGMHAFHVAFRGQKEIRIALPAMACAFLVGFAVAVLDKIL